MEVALSPHIIMLFVLQLAISIIIFVTVLLMMSVELWKLISIIFPQFTDYIITYRCWDLSKKGRVTSCSSYTDADRVIILITKIASTTHTNCKELKGRS